MRAIRFILLSLAIVFELSTNANGSEEIIKDRSPDGHFALELSRDEEGMFGIGVIDVASHKELVSLDSLGNPYAKHSDLVWSPDSKRVAYNEDNRRGGSATVSISIQPTDGTPFSTVAEERFP